MKVGFMTNHISYGGTEVALYDYAHFNEVLLGNTSVVLTRDLRNTHGEIYAKFAERFPIFYIANQSDIDKVVVEQKLDLLYVIKSGEVDWYTTTKCKCIVHCVFTTRHPHGHVYCAISDFLNTMCRTNVPVLPHMIHVDSHSDSFREELQISPETTVIGRYGSYDSFDIPFVYDAIQSLLQKDSTLLFLFMNTKPFIQHPRVIYIPRTTELYVKRKFINTCNVMLHARMRGETFGLSCGEFAFCNKPVITYAHSMEKAHIDTLGNKALLYSNKDSLEHIIEERQWKHVDMTGNGYMAYSPHNVMNVFASLGK
jgi:hypothetical protein